jgi:hypothetical protein
MRPGIPKTTIKFVGLGLFIAMKMPNLEMGSK